MKFSIPLALAVQGAAAFPAVLENVGRADAIVGQGGCTTSSLCNAPHSVSNAKIGYNPNAPTAAQKASAARTNCGQQGACHTFDNSQLVSQSGQYAYKPPTAGQIRGPCPGLNAAANHAYLPRSGVQTIPQTITGLMNMYGMSTDLGGVLAAYAIIFDGDLITMTWSLGGPPPTNTLGGLLGQPQGISWSHNKYEGDSSIGRCDAFVNGGDAHSLSTQRFATAFSTGLSDDRYTIDRFAQEFTKNTFRSEAINSHYFAPLFSTTLVAPAAYNFVINFMSNHSAAEPSGYLDGNTFKAFFGVTGNYPNFVWQKGQERMPPNWYRRPQDNQYNALSVFADLVPTFLAYPDSFRFGGNTNGVNTYTGIDIANFTGGVYNAQTLLQGNNLACFFFQNQQQAVPDELKGGLNDVAKAFTLLNGFLGSAFSSLSCPTLGKYDSSVFNQYPGRMYTPTAPKNTPVTC